MALKTDIRGMVWRYPDTFVVGREQIRQYANSVKATDPASVDEDAAAELGHKGLVAPLTFMFLGVYGALRAQLGLEALDLLRLRGVALFGTTQ